MNFLLVAIPVIIVVVGLIFVVVMFSDSNRHLKNMDTASQLELERKKEEALEKVRKLKERGFVPVEEPKNENLSQEDLNSKVNNQAEEIEKLKAELEKLKKNSKSKNISAVVSEKNLKLNFSKDSLVRGLITKEYLQKKNKR